MKFDINYNKISIGALSGAVVLVSTCAWVGISKMAFSEFGMYACLGLFLVLLFLHVFFRDENFDKLQAINSMMWTLLTWLTILPLYAFLVGSYLAMFISLGFFFVFYLMRLMQRVLQEESTNI